MDTTGTTITLSIDEAPADPVKIRTVGRFSGIPLVLGQAHLIAAIGDAHGMWRAFMALLVLAQNRGASDLVTLGDGIDRGPGSLRILDRLCRLDDALPEMRRHHMMGNHEHMLMNAVFHPDPDAREVAYSVWYNNGGAAVIAEAFDRSAGKSRLTLGDIFTGEHLSFMRSMRMSCTIGNALFVHAGIPAGLRCQAHELDAKLNVPLLINLRELEEDRHPLWVRSSFLNRRTEPLTVVQSNGNFRSTGGHLGHFVFHGHTPSSRVSLERDIVKNRLNLDGGSYRSGWVRMALISHDTIEVVEASSQADLADRGG